MQAQRYNADIKMEFMHYLFACTHTCFSSLQLHTVNINMSSSHSKVFASRPICRKDEELRTDHLTYSFFFKKKSRLSQTLSNLPIHHQD
jgi:hypothetical protein